MICCRQFRWINAYTLVPHVRIELFQLEQVESDGCDRWSQSGGLARVGGASRAVGAEVAMVEKGAVGAE
jgi:hypothetical protein